ncbi:MAG: protein TolR [Pseudomonadota bacterium]
MGASLNTGGRSRSGRRSYGQMAEINVTPFVDVMMVLLVVFMVAAPLLTAGVTIDLPDSEAKSIQQEDDKPLEITLDKDGNIFIGETQTPRNRMIAILKTTPTLNTESRIYIRADKDLDYGVVMDVLGSINGAGYKKVALVSNPSANNP